MSKILISLFLLFFLNKIQAQVNLTKPSENNLFLWVLADINNPLIDFYKLHENNNKRSSISIREEIPDWDCIAFGCSIEKTQIKTITLDQFNNNYRQKTINFLSIKNKFASDPLNECGRIEDYLRERAHDITYFIIDGNQVKVYLKAFCCILSPNDH